MNCSRCNAEAVVKRGSAAYCAKCALARDWEDVIAIVQEDRVDMAEVEVVAIDSSTGNGKAAEKEAATAAKEPAAVSAKANGAAAAEGLPADPFG